MVKDVETMITNMKAIRDIAHEMELEAPEIGVLANYIVPLTAVVSAWAEKVHIEQEGQRIRETLVDMLRPLQGNT